MGEACVSQCLHDKKEAGKEINDQAVAICHSECGESEDKASKDVLYKRVSTPVLQKLYKDSDKKYHLAAYISSTLRDRDGDRFSKDVMENWSNKINFNKVNLGQDHGHSWKDTLGVYKKAEVRQNPKGDDLKSAKFYLFADAILEDPEVNKDVALLIHKADIGEQISLSIAANPAAKNWYDLEVEKDGSNTRVIKSADLLKADVVGEPANPDARMIGIFLKHQKCSEGKCLPDCEGCYMEKDFAECITKSMIAPNTHVNSSLVNENANKNRMTQLSKEDQDKLNKEHGCKEGEEYCPDEGKCIPEEKEEMKSQLNPDVEKFIEAIKAISGADPNGTQTGGGLESIVQQALASMRTPPTAGKLELNIPSPTIPVTPGVSGTSGAQPQTTGTPATPTLNQIPIPTQVVQASPGNSGTGPAPASAQGTPMAPTLANPSPIPEVQVQASKQPTIEKRKTKSVLFDAKEMMKSAEEARKKVVPKHENPGEILPTLIDVSKITNTEMKKHAEAYNAEIVKAQAAQVRTIYTPNDIVEKSERGELLKELDENNTFTKTVKAMAKNKVEKKIVGSLLLTKAA